MISMTIVYNYDDIVIERDPKFRYRLLCSYCELFFYNDIVTDKDDSSVLSFKPKQEMWWDVKLFLNKTVSIGSCAGTGTEVPVTVKGLTKQDLFYNDAHILSRKKNTISLGPDFDLKNIEHYSVLLIMTAYRDHFT